MLRSSATFFFLALFGILCINFSSSFRFAHTALAVKTNVYSSSLTTQRPFQKVTMGNKLFALQGGSHGSGGVEEVDNLARLDKILEQAGNKLVVIDFSATWCGPCKMIAPFYHQLATSADYENVKFLKVDVDQAAEIAERYSVMSMPTFLFLKQKEEVHRFAGANPDRLTQTLKDYQ